MSRRMLKLKLSKQQKIGSNNLAAMKRSTEKLQRQQLASQIQLQNTIHAFTILLFFVVVFVLVFGFVYLMEQYSQTQCQCLQCLANQTQCKNTEQCLANQTQCRKVEQCLVNQTQCLANPNVAKTVGN